MVIAFVRPYPEVQYAAHGWGSGHVAVDRSHPLYLHTCDEVEESCVRLTSAHTLRSLPQLLNNAECIVGDMTLLRIRADWWVFGFDTFGGPDPARWPRRVVVGKTRQIAAALEEME